MEKIKQLKNSIIKELIKDTEYAEYLCEQNLRDINIIDLICCAPVPLTRKAEMLKSLSAYQGETEKQFSYKTYYDEVQKALAALTLKDDEIFLCVGHTREHGEDTQFEAFPSRSVDNICKFIKSEYEFDKETCDFWHKIEKWHDRKENEIDNIYDFNTDMTDDYTFTFVYDEICYFDDYWAREYSKGKHVKKEEYDIYNKFTLFNSGSNLNLPTHFDVGDILEVDGMPFAPKVRVVVLDNACKTDCCTPQCLYLTERGVDAGALKHSHIYKIRPFDNISPLYSVKRFTGELSVEENILKTVSDYVKGDRERGNKIWEIVTRREKTKGDSDYDAMRKLILRKYIGLISNDIEDTTKGKK